MDGVLTRHAVSKSVRGAGLLLLAAVSWIHADPVKLIQVHTERRDTATTFVIENLQSAEVTVSFDLHAQNALGIPDTSSFCLGPGSRTNYFTLRSQAGQREPDWSYTYHATWGAMEARHDDSHRYTLPFAPGRNFPVSQGPNGTFSHTGGDAHAIDFKMPEGTPVHSARDGIVAAIKVDSSAGGPDVRFEWDANFILIRHSDGTLGHYVHLQKDGSRVRVGQRVRAGDWIGLSGNTGRSTGPHLHFAVLRARDGRTRETFPIHFKESDPGDKSPSQPL